ncbi:AAA family ATPase [Sulfuriferula sp. AH1]|uniref:sigma-54 interaction domain-containing protein n=1 Tax=Sulfuriferula sp. AH1 TaxID=1985873 RepID=UPI000B3B0C7A|nr:sigma-54 dependent transcriptional regulator [Sulfuriferula sp. AH1]ARU31773.1 AAA family ATPase [Sulfuriferula sp. AH1]
MQKILISWIGNTDLKASKGQLNTGVGPIAQSLADRHFQRLVLLTNYSAEDSQQYVEWLETQHAIHPDLRVVSLSAPTEYAEIYKQAVEVLESITGPLERNTYELTFHLSPGTPAMAAIWIILSKTRFKASLLETSIERGTRLVNFPFDLAADFLPDLLKRQDEILAKLAQDLPPKGPAFNAIIHQCEKMQRLVSQAQRVAVRNVPVLIQGESGTGKELLARAIHETGLRREGPFVAVNCGAIPLDLVDAEFFGHDKGAFTGAQQARKGYFEEANGGTLFLDEIGELPLASQVKLLRVLQEKKVVRLGSAKEISLDVRIIAATNRNLIMEVAESRFREDLFHRIAIGVLQLPALRERGEDIGLLIDHSMEQINREANDQPGYLHKNISVSARKVMFDYAWPGNIRELHNTLLRASLWSIGQTITAEDIEAAILQPATRSSNAILEKSLGNGFDIQSVMSDVAGHYVHRAIEQAEGNKTKAAELLGLSSYQTLTNWIKKYQVE